MVLRALGLLLFWLALAIPMRAEAATCSQAGAQGTAPASWQTYCWLDFSTYNDTTARSGSGQAFSFTLSDGSTLSFRLKAGSNMGNPYFVSKTAPSWSGAAVGNSAFLSIPGKPILYTNVSGSLVTLTITNILVSPPPGVPTITNYAFVVADAESTDNSEYLEYTTNGSSWAVLDQVPPISGSQYPPITGTGTATFRESGGGLSGNVGAYIVASNAPTQVTVRMSAAGLQGVMFAVRFASIKLNKTITGARIAAADQFAFKISATGSGQVLAQGASTGTSNGPFTAAVVSTASGIPVTLSEAMAAGSTSTLSQYRGRLTCTNASAGSPTPMPTNLATSSYNFGALDFGDIVTCNFNNAAFPHVQLTKQLAAAGRIFANDQFTMRIRSGTNTLASTTTTGTGATVSNGATALLQLTEGTPIAMEELASGTTVLGRYAKVLSCTNAYAGSATTLPTAPGQIFTPAAGDVIRCTITNTRSTANAVLVVSKTSQLISDPTNGTLNPLAVPGARLRYSITVRNEGDAPVDAGKLVIIDKLPATLTLDTGVAVTFTNGATPSGLSSFNPATMVTYSSNPGGAAPFSHPPSGGLDPAVTAVRINPQGSLAASNGTNHPSFTVSFETIME